jgi:hypothetical protein
VAAGEGIVVRVRLLPAQPSGGTDRRALSDQLRAQIAAALD